MLPIADFVPPKNMTGFPLRIWSLSMDTSSLSCEAVVAGAPVNGSDCEAGASGGMALRRARSNCCDSPQTHPAVTGNSRVRSLSEWAWPSPFFALTSYFS